MRAKYNGVKNLITASQKSETELKEMARNGGIASGESKRSKKLMREILLDLLLLPIGDGELASIHDLAQSKGKNLTVSEAILLSQIRKAIRGDTAAAIFIRDTAGQKPKEDKIEIQDVVIQVSIVPDEDESELQ